MRIARYVPTGSPDPAFGIVELAEDAGNFPDTVATITGDPLAGPVNYTGERLPLAQVRLLAPVIPRSKVVAVGKNYAAHAAEMGSEVPSAPILFLKPNTSVIGPDEAIIKPFEISELSYEAELAVVIGRICRRVPLERVPEVIFGYTCANDVTARDGQRAEQQWTRAKGWDTFLPAGSVDRDPFERGRGPERACGQPRGWRASSGRQHQPDALVHSGTGLLRLQLHHLAAR